MYCKNCGKKLMENSMVCLNCGAKSVPVSSADPKTPDAIKVPESQINSQFGTVRKKSKLSFIITVLVVLGFGIWGYLGDSTNSTNVGFSNVGDYYCSDYHAAEADKLFTNVDYTNDIVALEALWYELENMTVNETNQDSVDFYQAKLADYDRRGAELDARIIASEGSIEEHDRKVLEYNNYLETNCE